MALRRVGLDTLAKIRKSLGSAAVRNHTLEVREDGPDTRHLCLGLVAAPEHAEGPGARAGQMPRRDGARSARPQATEVIGLEHARELGGLRVEDHDRVRRSPGRRRVELPPCHAEAGVRSGHVSEGPFWQAEPPPGRDLDLPRGHPTEALLDDLDRIRRLQQRCHVRLAEVERHCGECTVRAERRRLEALTSDDYLDLRLQEFLDRLGTADSAPGGGSAAALTIAFAAGLVGMVARCGTESWADASGVAAQARAIQERATALSRRDAEVWSAALAALRKADAQAGDERTNHELMRALDLAAAAPLEIAALGADVAELAVEASERCEGAFRADAAAAAALAAGGARAAAHLVEVNLTVREGDERLARARSSDQAATEAAERVLASVR